MSGTVWHRNSEFVKTEKSYLTGREIIINSHLEKFLVPDSWSPASIKAAMEELFQTWRNIKLKSYHKPSEKLWPFLNNFEGVCTVEEFGAALDAFFGQHKHWGRNHGDKAAWGPGTWRSTDKTRAIELLTALWRHDAIAWPVGVNPFPKQDYTRTYMFGCTEPIIAAFMEATAAHNKSFMRRTIVPLLLKRVGVREVGDLTARVVSGGMAKTYVEAYRMVAARALLLIQRGTYGMERITEVPSDFLQETDEDKARLAAQRVPKSGLRVANGLAPETFQWVVAQNPDLEPWRRYGIAWMAEVPRGRRENVTALNGFYKYLISVPEIPKDPRQYFNLRTKHDPPYSNPSRQIYNRVVDFLEWVLDSYFREEIEGVPVRPPELRNPLNKTTAPKVRYGESVRDALPTLFIQMLLEILTENDWEWAKKYAQGSKVGGDWFVHQDKVSGEYVTLWSPVRSVVLWVKLRMPFRTFQVRMLDSGEADTFAYDAATGGMKRNRGRLSTGTEKRPVQQGVIQFVKDQRLGREVGTLRINTNKTADTNKAVEDHGYDCPYAPPDVIKMLAWMRDWQVEYNPLPRPTRWEEVPEFARVKTAAQTKGRASCFLFRNPAGNSYPSAPIEGPWIFGLWAHLLLELEKRLADQGIVGPDATPYKLVDVDLVDNKVKYSPRYDLHCLRVTFITAFYEAGVPVEVLMKIVGHATVVMSLYYVKLGAASIAEQMEAGQERVLRESQENWVRHQKNLDLKTLRNAVAWNEDSGPSFFAECSSGSLVFMDIGVCPVACARCDVGGSKMTGDKTRSSDYAAVPGGRGNCAACRFIVSGPPFLHGLVAQFNAKSQAASEHASRRSVLERRFEELDAERRQAVTSRHPFLLHREWQKCGTDLDDITNRLDQLLLHMNALARLIEQSRRILAEGAAAGEESTALVVNDLASLETVFEETTEFDLVDRICQSSIFFQSVDPTSANIRRMRAYDRMLVRNGLQPAFLDMDEETSLLVGNQLSRLLTARVGPTNTLNLLEGTETIARLGFDVGELASEMSELTHRCVQIRPRLTHLVEAESAFELEAK